MATHLCPSICGLDLFAACSAHLDLWYRCRSFTNSSSIRIDCVFVFLSSSVSDENKRGIGHTGSHYANAVQSPYTRR